MENKYLKKITDYKPRKIDDYDTFPYIQTWPNCWIYYALNNLLFNTRIRVDNVDFEKFIESKGISVEKANTMTTAPVLLCEYVKKKLNKNIMAYQFGITDNTYLFAKLLMNGYCIGYLRDCGIAVLKDIGDDDEIDNVITRTTGSQHFSNVRFENRKLWELGTWGDDNKYNRFTYHDTDLFIKSVKAGGIRNQVLFIDFA